MLAELSSVCHTNCGNSETQTDKAGTSFFV